MPHLDGSGPKKQGSQTGRGLGQCRNASEKEIAEKLGKGMALRRKSGGGKGQGKRLKYDFDNIN